MIIKNQHDDHIWKTAYDHRTWPLYECDIWWSHVMILYKYDDHVRWSYMSVICDPRTWSSYVMILNTCLCCVRVCVRMRGAFVFMFVFAWTGVVFISLFELSVCSCSGNGVRCQPWFWCAYDKVWRMRQTALRLRHLSLGRIYFFAVRFWMDGGLHPPRLRLPL